MRTLSASTFIAATFTALLISALAAPPSHAQQDAIGTADGNSGAREGTAEGRDDLATAVAAENVALELGVGDVTPTGAFSYEIPIEIPVGRRGVAPTLALVYDSQIDDGLMGMGWTLRGLPAVVRIPHLRGISYDPGDTFALAMGGYGVPVSPGQRLVRQGNTNRFHTVDESWVEVEMLGTCSSGPCAWRMFDGKGNTLYFGTSGGSQLDKAAQGNGTTATGMRAWGLSRFEDAYGNSYTVTYREDTFMMYPERIEYGCATSITVPPPPPPPTTVFIPNDPSTGPPLIFESVPSTTFPVTGVSLGGSLTMTPTFGFTTTTTIPPTTTITITTTTPTSGCVAERELDFVYSTRNDKTALPHRYELRLAGIDVYSSNQPLRRYALGYDDTAPRSRLVTIDRLGADFATGLPRMTIGWSATPALPPTTTTTASWGNIAGVTVESHDGDLNGDGFGDLVRVSHAWQNRSIEYALGGLNGFGSRVVTSDAVGANTFRSLLADVNGDGKQDLISWFAANSVVEVYLGLGISTGLGARNRVFSSTTAAGFPGSSIYARMVPVDINGDLQTDLLLINQDTREALYFQGTATGLAAPRTLAGLGVVGATMKGEAVIVDINGDDFLDVVMPLTGSAALNEVNLFTWFGGKTGPGHIVNFKSSMGGAAAATPFQTLAGDFNGDGFGDVTLAWSGQPQGGAQSIPFGRDIRTFYGRPDLGSTGVEIASVVIQGSPSPALPAADFPGGHWAYWHHHAADLNDDGATDIVMTYHGVGGVRLQWLMGRPAGGFEALAELAAGTGVADGGETTHRWQTRIADVDMDGHDDLLRYYVGTTRTILDVFRGTNAGLAPYTRLHDVMVGDGPSPTTAASATSLSLLTPDGNGDGKPELVLSTWGRTLTLTSTPGPVDLVTSVANGMGGVARVTYEGAARHSGAVQPNTTTCGGGSGAACGIPYAGPRPLATRVTGETGRGFSHGETYTYANGRYKPGPVEAIGTTPVRADLGFEVITRVADGTGGLTRTRYRQLWPLQRSIAMQEVERPITPASSTRVLAQRDTFEYQQVTTSYNTITAQLTSHRVETYEGTALAHDRRSTYTYNAWGAMQSERECAAERPGSGDLCIEKRTDYAEDATTLPATRWLLNRPIRERTRVVGSELVLDWTERTYAGPNTTQVTSTRRLLCPEADLCTCYSSPNAAACIGARWVTTASGMQYDSGGNLTRLTDVLGRVLTYTYDTTFTTLLASESRTVTTGGSPQTFSVSRTYDYAGRVASETDVRGQVTSTAYDNLGRQRRVDRPGGGWETWEYLDFGTLAQQRIRHVRGLDATRTVYDERWFDGEGGVYLARNQADGGRTVDVRREQYYLSGKKVVIGSRPHFTGATSVPWIEVEHDALDRPLAYHRRLDAVVGGAGSRLGTLRRVTYQAGATMTEDNRAPVDSGTGVFGAAVWGATTHRFTARGKLAEIVDAGGGTTIYDYDQAGRLEFIDGPGAPGVQWTSYIYDGWGRARLRADSATGETIYLYDDAGRLTEKMDALGRSTAFTYDELDRPRTRATASGTVTWTYDGLGVGNGRGRLARVVDGSGSTDHLSYDAAGNLLAKRTTIGAQIFDESMTYDLANRMVSHTLPNRSVLGHRYSASGRLATVTLDGLPMADYGDYTAEDQPGVRTTAAGKTSYTYGTDGRVRTMITSASGATPQSQSYRYDAQGNVRNIFDNRSAAAKTSVAGINTDDTWTYAYDSLNRLTSATDAFGASTGYTYDATGNLTGMGALANTYHPREWIGDNVFFFCAPPTVPLGPPRCFTNRINQWHAWLDDAGQVTRKDNAAGSWSYQWDEQSQLRAVSLGSATHASFVYDADGRRRRKTMSKPGLAKTETYYLSDHYELRTQGSLRSTTVHVLGLGGERLASVTDKYQLAGVDLLADLFAAAGQRQTGTPIGLPSGKVTYLPNHLGTTSVMLDDLGRELVRYLYAPYGSVIVDRSTGRDAAMHGFTGQERDAESELMNYSARHYDPEMMRFNSADRVVPGDGADPQGFNRYAYCLGNPVRYRDPSGHDPTLGDYAGLMREMFFEFMKQVDVNGTPLTTPYLLWSGGAAGQAQASAAVPNGWFMAQTAEHQLALQEIAALGPGVKGRTPPWYAIWEKHSETVVRRAAISGTPTYSFGLDPVNPDVGTVQYRTELPTLARWGGLAGGLIIGTGALSLYSSMMSEHPAIQLGGSVAAVAEITGGIMYGSGALLASGDLMLYGATLSTTATWVGVGIVATVAVYDMGQNMVDWTARSRASGDWITAPDGYVANEDEIRWLQRHGAAPQEKYMPKK